MKTILITHGKKHNKLRIECESKEIAESCFKEQHPKVNIVKIEEI